MLLSCLSVFTFVVLAGQEPTSRQTATRAVEASLLAEVRAEQLAVEAPEPRPQIVAAPLFRPAVIPMAYVVGHDEQLSYGPSALRAAPDGSFWIVNPADNSLTNILAGGLILQQFHVAEAVALTDVTIRANGSLEVVDGATEPSTVLTISNFGTVIDRREAADIISFASGPRAPAATADGRGATSVQEGRWTLRAGTDDSPDGAVSSRAGTIVVKAGRGVIRGLRVLADESDSIVLLVEEVAEADTILVDATVRRYTNSGTLLGIARVPLAEQYTWVEHPVALSANGTAYILHHGRAVGTRTYDT